MKLKIEAWSQYRSVSLFLFYFHTEKVVKHHFKESSLEQGFFQALSNVVSNGRTDEESFKHTMPFWSQMARGESSRTTKLESHGANFKAKWSDSEVAAYHDNLLEDKMSISHEAFTLLIIDNYLMLDEASNWIFPAPLAKLKFTSRKSVGKDGSYSEEAIAGYNAMQTKVKEGRDMLKLRFKDSPLDRPDVFELPPQNVANIEAANSNGDVEPSSMPSDILVFGQDDEMENNEEQTKHDELDDILEMGSGKLDDDVVQQEEEDEAIGVYPKRLVT